ncbi:signal peptidase II [Nocardioides antri]|uniref:Lipoprotein signal peptidase n=1 Tax=Nocardioides antri TaxID=2607659 RepID=A0A5B1M8Z1_9ACTN|nr:signal peptidase II [Nocardioides antri]KAA1429008.1 signal peptidase II [Nocardioides antri]
MQAARGTSVDSSDSGSADRRGSFLASRAAWVLFAVVAAVLYAADQLSKRAAVEHLSRGEDVQVVGDLLQLHLTRNPGAAFSLGTQFTIVLTCLAICATAVVLWASRNLVDRVWAAGLGCLLAGITGNLTDRMLREPTPFRGHVVDFLQLPNWPIFNVADIAINVGAGLILLQVFRGVRMDGTRHRDDEDAA